jgi:hypothetical protein
MIHTEVILPGAFDSEHTSYLFPYTSGWRVSVPGLGMRAWDGCVDPFIVCVPACFSAEMSPAPLSRNTAQDGLDGVCQRFSQQHLPISCSPYVTFSVSLVPLAVFPLLSRMACLSVSLFLPPFVPLSQTINIPFISIFSWAQSDEATTLTV